jgi:hypothetical protein
MPKVDGKKKIGKAIEEEEENIFVVSTICKQDQFKRIEILHISKTWVMVLERIFSLLKDRSSDFCR